MKRTTPSRARAPLVLAVLLLAGCGGQEPSADSSAATSPSPAAAELGDPATQAILGSAERALQARHPGATLVLADQSLSKATAERTVCGRYIAVKRHWQGQRYFIANAVELAVVENGSARWKTTCDGAERLPGALTGPAVDAAVLEAIPLAGS
jgi:hypothetical protein